RHLQGRRRLRARNARSPPPRARPAGCDGEPDRADPGAAENEGLKPRSAPPRLRRLAGRCHFPGEDLAALELKRLRRGRKGDAVVVEGAFHALDRLTARPQEIALRTEFDPEAQIEVEGVAGDLIVEQLRLLVRHT